MKGTDRSKSVLHGTINSNNNKNKKTKTKESNYEMMCFIQWIAKTLWVEIAALLFHITINIHFNYVYVDCREKKNRQLWFYIWLNECKIDSFILIEKKTTKICGNYTFKVRDAIIVNRTYN